MFSGSLISFGLVGGNLKDYKDKKAGVDSPMMTIEEVIQFFKTASGHIFHDSNCCKQSLNWMFRCLPIPCFPFPQDGLGLQIDSKFGENADLKDFHHVSCVAGAVALQYDISEGDQKLKIFDTRSSISYSVKQVLKASSCAPVYFVTPTAVKDGDGYEIQFVDGGVGGNCPVVQAIPRMEELYHKVPNSTLSIAPPREKSKISNLLLVFNC